MKDKTVDFWIFKAIVPCAILCAVFAYSASTFQHESDALFNSFILLLSLSFGGVCVSSCMCVHQAIVDVSEMVGKAHDKGVPAKKLAWPFICLVLAAIAFCLCLYFGAVWTTATPISLAVFILLLFSPMAYSRLKNRHEAKTAEIIPDKESCAVKSTKAEKSNAFELSEEAVFVASDKEAISQSVEESQANESETAEAAILPTGLRSKTIRMLLDALVEEQLLGEEYQPFGAIPKSTLTYIAESINFIEPITSKWVVFESFWNLKDMSSALNKLKGDCSKVTHYNRVVRAFNNAAERNAMLANLVTFKAWKKHNPMKSERVF